MCLASCSIWLGTVDKCYVNQYDLVDYNGTCEFASMYRRKSMLLIHVRSD